MPGRFLPSLRGTSGRAQQPVTVAGLQSKQVLLADYYAALTASMGGQDRAKPWDVARAVSEGYERVVWAFKSVEAIAGNSSRLPFALRDASGVLEDHPLYHVLNDGMANPLETGRQFRKRLSAQILLSKRGAFVEVTKSMRGDVLRLDLLPPARTRPVPGRGTDLLSHFEVLSLDGYSKRPVEPERVRWFREPHPLDPYSGITPLEAAGLSIELDYFARLFNVNFMRNDGRPGGIVGVDGEMDEAEMDRVEARFGKGPVEAGKLSVINGALSYIDIAARPRDSQYQATSKNAKTEIIVAFGVPESQMGHASESTFANAAVEEEAFWTQTMANHNTLVVSGFAEDSDDDCKGFLDTTTVEALQRPLIARRAEMREEVAAGLRSIFNYAQAAGIDDIESTAMTRALLIATGKTPLPSREADAEALGMAAPEAAPGDEQPGSTSTAEQVTGAPEAGGGGPALPAGGAGQAALPAGSNQPVAARPYERAAPLTGPAVPVEAAAASAAADGDPAPGTKSLALALEGEVVTAPFRPSLKVIRGGAASPPVAPRGSVPDDASRDALEDALSAALERVGDRMLERTLTRLGSPKVRKGTRHWQAEGPADGRVGTKALDTDRVVEEARWAEEAEAEAAPVIEPAAAVAALALMAALGDEDDEGVLIERAASIVAGTVAAVLRLIVGSAARQGRLLADVLEDLDGQGLSLDEIGAAVRDRAASVAGWARGLATHAATALTEGSRYAGAQDLQARGHQIDRTWLSRRDHRVRETHDRPHGADGQVRALGEAFTVGGFAVRFPGDPAAPIRETANCRCRLLYRRRRTGTFVARPPGVDVKARVRTAAGVEHYGQAVGTVITRDIIERVARAAGAGGGGTSPAPASPAPAGGPGPRKPQKGTQPVGRLQAATGPTEVEDPEAAEAARATDADARAGSGVIPAEPASPGEIPLGEAYGAWLAERGVPARERAIPADLVARLPEDRQSEAYLAEIRALDMERWGTDGVPDDVTAEDLAEWRGEWLDEFPEEVADGDYPGASDSAVTSWKENWEDAPWRGDDGQTARDLPVYTGPVRDLLGWRAKGLIESNGEQWYQDRVASAAGQGMALHPDDLRMVPRDLLDEGLQEESIEATQAAWEADSTEARGGVALRTDVISLRQARDDGLITKAEHVTLSARVRAAKVHARRRGLVGEPVEEAGRLTEKANLHKVLARQARVDGGQEPGPLDPPKQRVNDLATLRESYELMVYQQMLDAEKATGGNFLSAAGKAADYPSTLLFYGKLSGRMASEELLGFWQDNPRRTWSEYRRGVAGFVSDDTSTYSPRKTDRYGRGTAPRRSGIMK